MHARFMKPLWHTSGPSKTLHAMRFRTVLMRCNVAIGPWPIVISVVSHATGLTRAALPRVPLATSVVARTTGPRLVLAHSVAVHARCSKAAAEAKGTDVGEAKDPGSKVSAQHQPRWWVSVWQWGWHWCAFRCVDHCCRYLGHEGVCLRNAGCAPFRLKVDTGTEGNILPQRIYRRMFPHNLDADDFPLVSKVTCQPAVKLRAYNGGEIRQHGSVSIPCSFKSSGWHDLQYFIAESEGPAILGISSWKQLDIVRLQCDDISPDAASGNPPEKVSFSDISDLKIMFPNRFDVTMGDFKGPHRLVPDRTVTPQVHPNRKYAIHRKLAIKQELSKMENMGVIAKITEQIDWVSSLTFTEKRGGGLRVCLDPKDMNHALKRPIHKTPTLEEITHHLAGATFFSKMDSKNGYCSVHLDDESSKLTTFHTPFGRYHFLWLPFGLVVSQDVFQQRMDVILEQCPGCIGIADDIAVYGRDTEEHDRNLMNLMHVAETQGFVFNSQKCVVRTKEIPFFGMIYSADGVRPDPAWIKAIQSLPVPENKTELQEFLGIATCIETFVPRLSHHTSMLRELLKQDVEFSWTAPRDQEFRKVKDQICHETTLTYFDPNKESVLQVDSSLHGLGAVMMQEGRPIAFASKSLPDTESHYANIERELLAVVYGCEHFHTYLYGKPFTAQYDHKPLEMIQLKNLLATPPRLQRACYCGCKITMWPSSISQGKCFSLQMGSHDSLGPSHLWKWNWIWPSTWFISARKTFKSYVTRLREILFSYPCATSSSMDGLTASSKWPSHSGHTGPTGMSCLFRMASFSKAVSKCSYLLPCKSTFLTPCTQVTKAVTNVNWEPSGVCFGMASMMALQNAWQHVQFAKRPLLSVRNLWCKAKRHSAISMAHNRCRFLWPHGKRIPARGWPLFKVPLCQVPALGL